VFRPIIEGRRHHFRVEGKYRATHVLVDDETASLWAPVSGLALHGPLAGTRLERLPVYQSTWREWKQLRPGTVVTRGRGERRDGHGERSISPDSVRTPRFAAGHEDPRLPGQELVLGVEVDGAARAYPLSVLRQQGAVLNGTLGARSIVVFARPGSWVCGAFEAVVDGRRLEFRAGADGVTFEETETGSVFDIAGEAITGPLAGKRLPLVVSGLEKWFGWAASHPGTEIYGVATPSPGRP
jgi:hypothetical protein